MATLNSPGVAVTVIDESFYTPAEPGTTPLIVVATGQDKINGAGTATASATTAANAGKAFKVTSQRDLVDLFGAPFFEKTASGSPIHGSERNEYGLLAAYSLLGVSNAAFVVRANVDLNQLEGTTDAPGANPDDGDWWFDTRNTAWGIFEWNGTSQTALNPDGQKFTAKTPIVLTKDDDTKVENSGSYGRAPKSSIGAIGDYCIVAESTPNDYNATKEPIRIFYKNLSNTWVLLGSKEWTKSHAAVKGTASSPTITVGQTFLINGTAVTATGTTVTQLAIDITNTAIDGISAAAVGNRLEIYVDGTADTVGDSSLSNAVIIASGGSTPGTILTDVGLTAGTYYGPKLQMSPHTTVPLFKIGDPTDDNLVTDPEEETTDYPDLTMTYGRPTGSVWVKTTEPNSGSRWRVKRWSSSLGSWVDFTAPLYESTHAALYGLNASGGGTGIPQNSVFVQYNYLQESGYDDTPKTATFRIWRRKQTGATTVTSAAIADGDFTAGTNTFTLRESKKNILRLAAAQTISFTAITGSGSGEENANRIAAAINAAGFTNITASVTTDFEVVITHALGGDMRFVEGTNSPLGIMFTAFDLDALTGTANYYAVPAQPRYSSSASNIFVATNWIPIAAASADFTASSSAPENEAADGQLWYNPAFSEVDIMVHNGTTWKGYAGVYPNADPAGPIVSATQPTTQSDGSALVNGDLWISTADLENFPTIYRYNSNTVAWDLIDKTDQTTENGILFADARYGLSGASGNTEASIVDLLTNDYLDPDAPDPALYPKGMLLWNLRRSGGNVKRYANNYIDQTADNDRYLGQSMSAYATDRWVTASANNEDGSGSFGRKAQRKVVIAALKSVVDTSAEIRDEERRNFNLIAAPGYPELLSNLVNLNIERGLTAFVVGDTPFRLASDATTLTNWGTNANNALDNGDDGIVTYDEYSAVFYPNGFTTDLSGANAVVPASHMMLRTIALSDQVSYPWFAPAGTRRGGITNATSVGYIDSATGEFQVVSLNEGQRDTLYNVKVNPITFFNGIGLVNYGQKTRARNASSLDRINVARLTAYLRSQFAKLARPYVFEPNDKITRDEIKQACDSLLLELVGLRAIYDFAVVCDETNNTPSRIDRNELYVDVAIEPVKAIEFIYIPLRLKNTGEI